MIFVAEKLTNAQVKSDQRENAEEILRWRHFNWSLKDVIANVLSSFFACCDCPYNRQQVVPLLAS